VSTRGLAVRVLIGLGLVCGAVIALASSVLLHGIVVLVVLFVAGFAAAVAYQIPDDDRAASVDAAWKAAAGTVALILLVTGVGVLAGGGVAAVVSFLAVVAGGAAWLLMTRRAQRAGRGAPGRAPATGDGDPAAALPAVLLGHSQIPVSLLSTSALGTEWLRTKAALASSLEQTARQAVIRHRQETLDELERRDPAGFARWLGAGTAVDSDPATFVRGDRTRGRDAA
jgi:hypothetical protein